MYLFIFNANPTMATFGVSLSQKWLNKRVLLLSHFWLNETKFLILKLQVNMPNFGMILRLRILYKSILIVSHKLFELPSMKGIARSQFITYVCSTTEIYWFWFDVKYIILKIDFITWDCYRQQKYYCNDIHNFIWYRISCISGFWF